jgi:flagella basal body P-ring formation protein FlgA
LYAAHPAKAQSIADRIAVAAHDLVRGTVLSATDITWTADSVAPHRLIRNSAKKVSAVAPGWIVRRNIRAGEPLNEPSVSRPDLVSTGDLVDVVYHDDGVSIKLRGTAVGSGAKGDEIYVKLDNRRRLRGVVEGANTVRIL